MNLGHVDVLPSLLAELVASNPEKQKKQYLVHCEHICIWYVYVYVYVCIYIYIYIYLFIYEATQSEPIT